LITATIALGRIPPLGIGLRHSVTVGAGEPGASMRVSRSTRQ